MRYEAAVVCRHTTAASYLIVKILKFIRKVYVDSPKLTKV